MHEMDQVVKQSLTEFVEDVFANSWWGKEREAISYYVFGYLIKHCQAGTVLYDPAQIGIEVRVPKAVGIGKKREITKDLIIWPEPGWTCWDEQGQPTRLPLAVLEWKVNQGRVYDGDVKWLVAFSANRPHFTGYAVCMDLVQRSFRLSVARVHDQAVQHDWLRL